MEARARSIVFWPGLTTDINDARATFGTVKRMLLHRPVSHLHHMTLQPLHLRRSHRISLNVAVTITLSSLTGYQGGPKCSSPLLVHLSREQKDSSPV